MRERSPYPMPDFEVEPPVKVDVVEREYRQRQADREPRQDSNYRIECHAYESQVDLQSDSDRGIYPTNAAECKVLTLDASTNSERQVTNFKVNTVADQRAAVARDNKTRHPLKAYGDTPQGEFTLQEITLDRPIGGGRTKDIYVDMKATGGPALLDSRRESFSEIDLHSGHVTHGCMGATNKNLEKLVDALAETSEGTLAERVARANKLLRKNKVKLTLDRDLDEPNTVWP